MSMSSLRSGIATRLDTIPGLHVYDYQPDTIRPPVAFVVPDRIEYDTNNNRGLDNYFFTINLIVSRADDRSAQSKLDTFAVGTASVKAAVEADRTLGGAANTCRVAEMRNYQAVIVNDVPYLSCQFELEVWA